jgi:elongation factor P
MGSTADFRTNMIIELDGVVFKLVEFQHVKPGKGGAFVRTKLKNVLTGAVLERTFRAGEKIEEVRLERADTQFLYRDGDLYHFMDLETYDQFAVSKEIVGDAAQFIKENDPVKIMTRAGQPFLVEIPSHVILAVGQTEPGVKGDTATGATKPAVLETGFTVNVPLFIEEGDRLKIDTRTGDYIERVNK